MFAIIENRLIYFFCIMILSYFPAGASYAFDENKPLLAVTLNYPPYEYIENGEAKGIAVDIIREAVRRASAKKVIFKFYPWKRAVQSAQFGESDILFNAGKNEERQLWGSYVESILIQQKYVLFKKKGVNIQVTPNFDNVKHRKIALRRGYLYGSGPFRQALDNNKFKEIFHSNSTKQSINLLLAGRVDFVVGDYLPVMHFLKENNLNDRVDIIKKSNQNTDNMVVLIWPTYILFSKKNIKDEYVEAVNSAMESMKSDGFYEQVLKKYGY